MRSHKEYLIERVPQLLRELTTETRPCFGIMSPQHMVEHLIWVSKSSVKNIGQQEGELTPAQMGFKSFVQKGANFRYQYKDMKREDLEPPRMNNLQEAIDQVPEAISRLYHYDEQHTFYNPMMGTFTFAEMELFHRKHYEHHLQRQFGLGLKDW